MDKKSLKELKRFFLLSGLPLEFSVSKIFQKMDFLDIGEYFYERDGKVFSIDMFARMAKHFEDKKIPSLYLDFLVECKYRERSHKWFFIPFEAGSYTKISGKKVRISRSMRTYHYDNIITFPIVSDNAIMNKFVTDHMDTMPVFSEISNKGIELYDKGFNPNSINEAISQVLFGTSYAFYERIYEYYEYTDKSKSIFVIIPVIITTTELYVPKKDFELENISKNNLEKLFKKVDSVLYVSRIPLYLKLYNKKLSNDLISKLGPKLSKSQDEALNNVIDFFIEFQPTSVFIINYRKTKQEVDKIKKYYLDHFNTLKNKFK